MIGLLLCLAATAVDGDTIRCRNQPVAIRLLGIDTPDHSWSYPCRAHIGNHVCDDAKANAASASMRAALVRGTVRFLPITHDRYGRIVAEVFVDNGDLQCFQLRAGVARYIASYDTGRRIAHRCPRLTGGVE